MHCKVLPLIGLVLSLCVPPSLTFAQSTLGYDPDVDPAVLVAEAQQKAATNGKRILVVAGGDWCIWCHYLDAFLTENGDLENAFKDTFVVVKAYFGGDKDYEEFYAGLPEAVGYPHFWILAADGQVLASQNTLPLEDGNKSYDRNQFLAFIDEWR